MRDAHIKAIGYELLTDPANKPNQQTIDETHHLVQRGGLGQCATTSLSPWEVATQLAGAQAAASAGAGFRAFDSAGRMAMEVPRIKDLLGEDESEKPEEVAAGEGAALPVARRSAVLGGCIRDADTSLAEACVRTVLARHGSNTEPRPAGA